MLPESVLPGFAPVPWALQWRMPRELSPTSSLDAAVHCWKILGLGCRSTFLGSLGKSQGEEFLGLPPQGNPRMYSICINPSNRQLSNP